jgi:hypothetical protein
MLFFITVFLTTLGASLLFYTLLCLFRELGRTTSKEVVFWEDTFSAQGGMPYVIKAPDLLKKSSKTKKKAANH